MPLLYAFVIGGAWLMFMLQPLVGRLLLPAYGGGFQVWSTCMMVFQGVLLFGYAYAHWLLPRLGRRHVAIIGLSLFALPLAVTIPAHPSGETAELVIVLLAHVAAPFAVLATTGVAGQLYLTQRGGERARDPYPLYAASNFGSLLGLLSYPFLIEPWLGLATQRLLWSAAYVCYAALATAITLRLSRVDSASARERSSARNLLYWCGLSASAVMLMLGATNMIALGAGSVPLVWVLTLATYLASFVATFRREPGHTPALRRHAPIAALFAMTTFIEPLSLPELVRIGVLLVALYALCGAAHAELYASRPPAAQLTGFYLAIAAGGFAGGSFVTLAAPALFRGLDEVPIALVLLLLLLALGHRRALGTWLRARTSWASPWRHHYGRWVLVIALVGAAGWLGGRYFSPSSEYVLRSPYGIFSISDRVHGRGTTRRTLRMLNHNHTTHGVQSLRADERRVPTAYYHRNSPLGELLAALPRPARMGVVGLGAGTLAAYFEQGDELVFYEIDPRVERIARSWFSFLSDCPAKVRVAIGDARLSLQREAGAKRHTALLVDAFSGDAIPFHLLTREALALYLSRVEPGAPVIFHISNRFYELAPSLAATARSLGAYAAVKEHARRETDRIARLEWATRYLVISTDRARIDRLGSRGWVPIERPRTAAWSDDRVNLLDAWWERQALD